MPSPRERAPTILHRRQVLALGAAMVAGRLVTACKGKTASAKVASDARALAAGTCVVNEAADAGALAWATGGTASMTAKASYPNPFAAGCNAPRAAAATCELTEGPCYSAQSVEIRDISYGYAGLPTRLYFQVVNEAREPVPGAVVDVWHVSPVGKYSGSDDAHEDVSFCTDDDPDFTSHLYFRGKQTTGADGIVYFDTCFPGWYASRTVHVHLTIRVGGKAYVTTQLCFDDALVDAIVARQPLYAARGARDTTNAGDMVFSDVDTKAYELATARMPDGAMLAWKTIVLRSSLAEAICGGGGGPAPP